MTCESLLSVINSVSAHRSNTMEKGTALRFTVETALARYHLENPNGDSFAITLTFPPYMSIMETWVKAALVKNSLIKLFRTRAAFGGLAMSYCVVAIEVHRGTGTKLSKVITVKFYSCE